MSDKLTIKQLIERDGMYVSPPHGQSMWPMLRDRTDIACVIKPDRELKKHDVALYIRSNGQYVLHRIMKINKDGYTMCGDHQLVLEHNIQREQIIGVLDSFYRGDKLFKCRGVRYKAYVNLWCMSLHLRKYLIKITGYIEKKSKKESTK